MQELLQRHRILNPWSSHPIQNYEYDLNIRQRMDFWLFWSCFTNLLERKALRPKRSLPRRPFLWRWKNLQTFPSTTYIFVNSADAKTLYSCWPSYVPAVNEGQQSDRECRQKLNREFRQFAGFEEWLQHVFGKCQSNHSVRSKEWWMKHRIKDEYWK